MRTNNKKSTYIFIASCLWLGCLAGPLWAEKISFSGDTMQAVMAKGRERTILTGNAYLITEDTEIHAGQIELFGEDFIFATCSGNVTVLQRKDELDIRCDKLFYNRRDKIIRLSGNAVMEDKKNEVVVKGGLIEDRENEDVTFIQIGARILKKDLVCRSHMARYFRGEQKLELYGQPQVTKNGDVYEATKISVDIKNDKVTLEGDVSAQVHYTSEGKKTNDDKNDDKNKDGKNETPATPNPESDVKATPAPSPTAAVPQVTTGRPVTPAARSAAPSGTANKE